jgi:hypothetical protein
VPRLRGAAEGQDGGSEALAEKGGWQMTNARCDICCGRGTIRLPVYRPVSVATTAEPPVSMDEASRSYPCPECSNPVPQDRVAIVQAHTVVDSRHEGDPNFMRHAKESAAHALVAQLLKGGYIRYERGPTDSHQWRFNSVATLGVVSQSHVATLEQRIAERQEELANELVAVAEEQSRHWGSYYTGREGPIQKSEVLRFLREALKGALAKRAMKAA